MDNSIYVALSKQTGTMRQLSIIANNLANANTPGYQGEEIQFQPYLVKDAGSKKTAFTYDIGSYRNTMPGTLEMTKNPLDFAIDGAAYFAVRTADGETKYTKAGNFTIDGEGALATVDGAKVLDNAGSEIEFEEDDKEIVVFADGRMEVDGEQRSSLGMYKFENEQNLVRTGSTLFTANEVPAAADDSRIMQGTLERANVQPITQITNLIDVQREFNNTSKFISGMYELQDGAIRTLARQGS